MLREHRQPSGELVSHTPKSTQLELPLLLDQSKAKGLPAYYRKASLLLCVRNVVRVCVPGPAARSN
jgi:hypothetical protein